MNQSPEGVSVVIPFHNEEPNLLPLYERLVPPLESTGREFEIVLVDDGSTDGGAGISDAIAARDPRVHALHLTSRSGQTAALDAGFRAARMPVVVSLDADLQNDPADIPILLTAMVDADVVCGVRIHRMDSFVRRMSSRIANSVRDSLTGDRITDTGCSLKAYRRGLLTKLKLFDGMHRFLPTLLRIEGARVVEVPVRHHPRHAGRTKYGIRNRALRGLRDCLAVRWMRDRTLRYRIKG